MKKYAFSFLLILILMFLVFLPKVNAGSSAKLKTIGPSDYIINPNIVYGTSSPLNDTFQVALELSSVQGTAGISYLKIRMTFDENKLDCYGGAFYSLPTCSYWDPPAGHYSEYITFRDDNYNENDEYLKNGDHFYAVNFKPKSNASGKTSIKFDVISAMDADGKSLDMPTAIHTINLGGSNTDTNKATTKSNTNKNTTNTNTTTANAKTNKSNTNTNKSVTNSNTTSNNVKNTKQANEVSNNVVENILNFENFSFSKSNTILGIENNMNTLNEYENMTNTITTSSNTLLENSNQSFPSKNIFAVTIISIIILAIIVFIIKFILKNRKI